MNKPQARLAFRTEGDWWMVYMAPPNTMEGAILLSSIKMVLVQNEERKQDYIELMRGAFSELITATIGVAEVEYEVQQAPEHERMGNA